MRRALLAVGVGLALADQLTNRLPGGPVQPSTLSDLDVIDALAPRRFSNLKGRVAGVAEVTQGQRDIGAVGRGAGQQCLVRASAGPRDAAKFEHADSPAHCL